MTGNNKPVLKILILIIVVIVTGLVVKAVFFGGKEYSEDVSKETVREDSVTDSAADEKITVDISGAVVNPGVYVFSEQSLVEDVINLAGGLTEDADRDSINRSEKIYDGMKIIVPRKEAQSSVDIYKDILNMDIDD